MDKATLVNGPAYFERLPRPAEGYKGPYKTRVMDTDSAIETPDDQHHRLPPEASRSAASTTSPQLPQTVPVPEAKDTGAKYKEHVVSSGPYMFDRTTRPARASRWSATRTGTRRPTRTARRCRTATRSSSTSTPTTSTTGCSPATSTSTSPAPVCSRPPSAGCSVTRRIKAQRRQPVQRAPLVHLDQPDGRAVRQHRVPQGRRVRRGPHRLPDRLRRPARRWRHRHHAAAAAGPGLPEVRPVPGRRGQHG